MTQRVYKTITTTLFRMDVPSADAELLSWI